MTAPEARRPLAPGMVVGDYELGPELGHGGMAAVYRARQRSLGRDVALKVADMDEETRTESERRFRREARTLARFAHPNLVSVIDAGDLEGVRFLAMELVEGQSLYQLLEESGPLRPLAALTMTRAVADALAYLHEHGVIHRDVKPGNVLISHQGEVKLADFGLCWAKDATELTAAGRVVGTVRYLAPEGLMGHGPGPAFDIYSLGVTLYESLCGSIPYPSERDGLLRALMSGTPRPISAQLPGMPGALATFVMSLIDRVPSARPSSAEVMTRVDELLSDPDIEAFDAGVLTVRSRPAPAGGDPSTSILNHASASKKTAVIRRPGATVERAGLRWGALAAGLLVVLGMLVVGHRVRGGRTVAPLLEDGETGRSSPAPASPGAATAGSAPDAARPEGRREGSSSGEGGPGGSVPAGSVSGGAAGSVLPPPPGVHAEYIARIDAVLRRHRTEIRAERDRRVSSDPSLAGVPGLSIVSRRGVRGAYEALALAVGLIREAQRGGLSGPEWLQIERVTDDAVEAARESGGFEPGSSLAPGLTGIQEALPVPGTDPFRAALHASLSTRLSLLPVLTVERALDRTNRLTAAIDRCVAIDPGWAASGPGLAARLRFAHLAAGRWADGWNPRLSGQEADHLAKFFARRREMRETIRGLAPRFRALISSCPPDLSLAVSADILPHLLAIAQESGDPARVREAVGLVVALWPLADPERIPRDRRFEAALRAVAALPDGRDAAVAGFDLLGAYRAARGDGAGTGR